MGKNTEQDKKLISDADNLCLALIEYCQNTPTKTMEIKIIETLLNCLYEKIEKLYIEIINK